MSNLLTSAFNFKEIFGNIISHWYYYLALLVVIIFLIVFFALKKQPVRNNLSKTQKLVYTAVFASLSAVVNCLTYYPVSYIAISFTSTICFVSGILLGAKLGFTVGFVGDLLGALLFPAGVYNPLIGIASGLSGFIPAIIFDYVKGNFYVKTIISFVLTLIICTSGINTFALWLMYGMGKKTFWAYLIARLPWQVIVCVGNAIISSLITLLLRKILPKGKFAFNENSLENAKESN